ncbi:hypothetical protein BU24DRAFT_101958 [Aaosphaeria arxii CBS 175.79]|uniref:Uncharacterized protein n=1 Tax=Aaosphaeria arxii CBS 175.79 TaxID=1450172 RepID=A0A6A5Y1H9_9PLEO|nr:uncharacterized protein BU24DRAFT_101958 [Aaosphaeria arxii CBS 175.79]KAF2018680.1 hypothetical protein BU24DRAFT_101958 [Aaosphaeria arxii CBS 175.79]
MLGAGLLVLIEHSPVWGVVNISAFVTTLLLICHFTDSISVIIVCSLLYRYFNSFLRRTPVLQSCYLYSGPSDCTA